MSRCLQDVLPKLKKAIQWFGLTQYIIAIDWIPTNGSKECCLFLLDCSYFSPGVLINNSLICFIGKLAALLSTSFGLPWLVMLDRGFGKVSRNSCSLLWIIAGLFNQSFVKASREQSLQSILKETFYSSES